MDTNAAISLMSALAQPTRLRVTAALAQKAPEGMSVGDLARLADTPHNTMSSHLAILARAGAIVAARQGRSVEYRADMNALAGISDFLGGLKNASA